MKSLKIWHRIAIIFLVMLAANIVSLGIVDSAKDEPIIFVDEERNGILYLEPLRQLRQSLPVYRRLVETDPKLADPAANPPSLMKIEEAMSRLDGLDQRLAHELTTTEDFVELKTNWAQLKAAVSNPELFRQTYTKTMVRVRALIALAGDSSGLILDSVLKTYYLINVIVVDLPNSDHLLNDLSSVEDGGQLLVMAAALKRELDNTNSHLEVAIEEDEELASLDLQRREHETEVLALLARLEKNVINQKSAKIAPADYAAVIQPALDANFRLYDAVAPGLDRVLQQRGDSLRADKTRVIGLILLLSLAGLILTVWISRSMIVPIQQAIQALEAPDGAEVSIVSTNQDEISRLIKAATTRKSPVVKEVRETPGAEVQELKSLVAELVIENRTLKGKSARTASN